MADLSTTVNGLKMPNPFVIGSGPPGTNANVIGKAFDEGWGAVIAKELISDRSFETWMDEFKQLKDKYPDRILIASIMEEYRKDAWCEIVEKCQDVGVDAFELNLSCPHGLPERKMGSAMGVNPDLVEEVTGWAMSVAKVPVHDSKCLGSRLGKPSPRALR